MPELNADIPWFRTLVRRDYTTAGKRHADLYLPAIVFAVTALPERSLAFQAVFTDGQHGGAMWARLPIGALTTKETSRWPDDEVQPWDCPSSQISVMAFAFIKSMPVRVHVKKRTFFGRYLFTVDYYGSRLAEDPEQHKQAHVIELECGQIVAYPNNRLYLGDSAFWEVAARRPDFEAYTRRHSGEHLSLDDLKASSSPEHHRKAARRAP